MSPLFRRADATPARDVPAFRRMMPYLMPTRNESAVYFEQEIDLTRTTAFLEAFNRSSPRRITVFHVFLWAAVKALGERPRLNRFVSGGRIYQRDGVWISFSAKKSLTRDAPIVVLKRRFDPASSFPDLVREIFGEVAVGRSDVESQVDRELSLALKLPGPILRWGLRLVRWLDRWNLLPSAFIRSDPLYASLFVANLGSVRLDSAYHHLYEYGNIPLFAALGRTTTVLRVGPSGTPERRNVCSIKYSFDERIEDGLYCAGALQRVREIVEDPEAHGATRRDADDARTSPDS